jgi:hypothetical protein
MDESISFCSVFMVERKCTNHANAVFITIISIPMHFKKVPQTNFAKFCFLEKRYTHTESIERFIGPGFLSVLWFGSSPTQYPPTSVSKLSLFLRLPVCRRSSLLTREGGGRNKIIRRWESLVVHKPSNTNTLWTYTSVMMLVTRLFWKSSSDSRSFSS